MHSPRNNSTGGEDPAAPRKSQKNSHSLSNSTSLSSLLRRWPPPRPRSAAKSFCHSLKRFFKAPWEITGPCRDPEYRIALPKATEYRRFSPATAPAKACVPTADPGTVFDIKYYIRDPRRDRPPVRRTVLKKADVEKMMAEKVLGAADFPPVYLTVQVQEDDNARGGGYQK